MNRVKNILVRNKYYLLLFFSTLIVGILLRIYRFNDIPYLIPPAASYYAFDGYSLVTNPRFQVFFSENTGREGMFMYLLAIFYGIFGYQFIVMKLVVLMINLITLFFIPIFVYRLARNKWIALFSLFYFSIMNWVIVQNRLPFRFNQTILFEMILIISFSWFVFKPRVLTAFISGALAGIGFYTYLSYRSNLILLGLLFLFLFFYNIFVKKEKVFRILFLSFVYILSVFIVITPLISYFISHKEEFFNRITDTSVFSHHSHPYGVIRKNILTYFNDYLIYGLKYNFSGQVLLNYSFIVIFLTTFFSLAKKKWKIFYLCLIVIGGFASYGSIALTLYNYYDWRGYYEDHVFYGLALYKTLAVTFALYFLIYLKNKYSKFFIFLFIILFVFSSYSELLRTSTFFKNYAENDIVSEHKYADSILDLAKQSDYLFYFENEEFKRFNLRVQPTIENNRITRNQKNNIYYIFSADQLNVISKLPCASKKCFVVFALNGGVHPGNQKFTEALLSNFGGKIGPNRDFGNNFFYFTWSND